MTADNSLRETSAVLPPSHEEKALENYYIKGMDGTYINDYWDFFVYYMEVWLEKEVTHLP